MTGAFRTAALIAALAVALIVGAVMCGVPAQPDRADSVPLAVYRGAADAGRDRLPAYEEFVGRDVTFVIEYIDVDTEENQTWPDWQASAWEGTKYRLVLGSTGIGPEEGFSWQRAASGDYDDLWRTLGERLVATGHADTVLRGAHEFNGDWFFYRVDPGQETDFVAAWRRWVDIMRAVPGGEFTFDWNPVVGSDGVSDAFASYPGDDYVDRVALDVYDGWYEDGWATSAEQPDDSERDEVWASILDGERGLRFWHDFAVKHDKPLSFPEWGIRTWTEDDDGLVHGGGDDASFVERMADLIGDPEWNVAYHGFWEDPTKGGAGVSDPDDDRLVPVPESRQAFLDRFGG